jgi:ESF2/ABP1 family protein
MSRAFEFPPHLHTMATRKRNEWLDAEESDDERGYDSEEESRARMLPTSKRQKLEHDSAEEDEDDIGDDIEDVEEAEEDDEQDEGAITTHKHAKPQDDTDRELARLEALAANIPTHLQPKQPLTAPIPLASGSKKDKSGIIYLSRCPPFMKPLVLRSLLTPYGTVGRIFLTPESTTSRSSRLKGGGSRRKLFLDGWVEFLSKKDAKFVAENLNAQTMGGKKRGRWHDEVWNIKYLSGVKWSNLVEQIQNENKEREVRMRNEISKGKDENRRFLENVERGKMIDGIAAKRKKQDDGESGDKGEKSKEREQKEKDKRPRREFKQVEVKYKALKKPEPGQDAQRVLKSIF